MGHPLLMHNYGKNGYFMTSNPIHKSSILRHSVVSSCLICLQKYVPFSCLCLPITFMVTLKESHAVTDCFMQKEGTESLQASRVTQVLNYFPRHAIFCVFPLRRDNYVVSSNVQGTCLWAVIHEVKHNLRQGMVCLVLVKHFFEKFQVP